jgi:hypothetical protein
MILAPLAGMTLLIGVATGPNIGPSDAAIPLSIPQKNAAMQPLVRSATDCIAQAVAADPRFRKKDLGDLIVDSIASCVGPVRTMIDAYDRYFGEGTGEAFFMGPYLDVLPKVVLKWADDRSN